MLHTNIKSCIEKILKKNKRESSWTDFHYIYFTDNKAVFFNGHILYEIEKSKVQNIINPVFIANDKQFNTTKRIYTGDYKKVIKNTNEACDSITITYKQALSLKTQQKENSYGLKYVKLESEKMVINIVLNNLLDCFRIFQDESLTLYLYKSNINNNKWYDNETNKELTISPYIIRSNNNIFVGAPLCPVNAYKKEEVA